jgi:hypothetical protein
VEELFPSWGSSGVLCALPLGLLPASSFIAMDASQHLTEAVEQGGGSTAHGSTTGVGSTGTDRSESLHSQHQDQHQQIVRITKAGRVLLYGTMDDEFHQEDGVAMVMVGARAEPSSVASVISRLLRKSHPAEAQTPMRSIDKTMVFRHVCDIVKIRSGGGGAKHYSTNADEKQDIPISNGDSISYSGDSMDRDGTSALSFVDSVATSAPWKALLAFSGETRSSIVSICGAQDITT